MQLSNMGHPMRFLRGATYQTRQLLAGYMGVPTLQPNALPNSEKFCTVPSVRHLPGLCGVSVG